MAKRSYAKPAISIHDQVRTLAARGLVLADPGRAEHYVRFIGYYRLSGYTRYYADPTDPANERFQAGTTFDQLLALYVFDRKLRVLLQDALERIEVAVKSVMSNECGIKGGPFWLTNANNFDRGSHANILAAIEETLGEEKEDNKHVYLTGC
ncbi:MAG: Abi family protein [Hyphomicrobiales bacterium]|nr:Abi family protein [Hyphomicrobiales bacterium]